MPVVNWASNQAGLSGQIEILISALETPKSSDLGFSPETLNVRLPPQIKEFDKIRRQKIVSDDGLSFGTNLLFYVGRICFATLSYLFCIFGQDLEDLQANGPQNLIQHQLLLQIDLSSGLYDQKSHQN